MKNTFKSRDAAGLQYPEPGGGGGAFVINVYGTYDATTADKTYEEVLEAFKSGQYTIVNAYWVEDAEDPEYVGTLLCTGCAWDVIYFGYVVPGDTNWESRGHLLQDFFQITVASDGTWGWVNG